MSSPDPILVPALRTLRAEVNERWPHRDRSSDGWIGDDAHRQRLSDHNPDDQGNVHALDITARGIQPWTVVIAATHHLATTYVIFRGRLWSRRNEWVAERYTGPDPHTTHLHVSVSAEPARANSRRPWLR